MSENFQSDNDGADTRREVPTRIYFSSEARRELSALSSFDKGEVLAALEGLRNGFRTTRPLGSSRSGKSLEILTAGDLSMILRALSAEERARQGAVSDKAYIVLALTPARAQLSADELHMLLG